MANKTNKEKRNKRKANAFFVFLAKILNYPMISLLGKWNTPTFLMKKRWQENEKHNAKIKVTFPVNGQHLQPVAELKVGRGTFAKNGCGILAVCNLLYLIGRDPQLEAVTRQMEQKGLIMDGHLGAHPVTIKKILQEQGLDVACYRSVEEWEEDTERKYGILFYWWVSEASFAAHYITLKRREDKIELYNLYGKENKTYQCKDLETFLNGGFYKRMIVLLAVKE